MMPQLKFCLAVCGFLLTLAILPNSAPGQETTLPDAPQPQDQSKESNPQQDRPARPSKNHIFWVIPNYRADENTAEIKPLTPKAKFKIAVSDSFDPSAFLVAGALAGLADAQNSYREYGDGAEALGKYFAASFADQAIGNMMTEAVFPVALRQDPRYFVKGRGGFWKRTGYAISREVITRGDDGRSQFNTSEIAGNAVAAGTSNAYTPAAERSLGNTMSKWGTQIGLDTFFNVLKEFWPDVRDKLFAGQ